MNTSLTELQIAVMRVLWRRGAATVAEVQDELRRDGRPLAQTTVATLLTRLAKRDVVGCRPAERPYVYEPRVTEVEVRGDVLNGVAEQLFEGDVAELVAHLLTAREVEPGDLARIREMIEARERRVEED